MAVSELNKEGLHPKFHQLDIEDMASVDKLKCHLVENYGGLDVLVNNAGFAYKVILYILANDIQLITPHR